MNTNKNLQTFISYLQVLKSVWEINDLEIFKKFTDIYYIYQRDFREINILKENKDFYRYIRAFDEIIWEYEIKKTEFNYFEWDFEIKDILKILNILLDLLLQDIEKVNIAIFKKEIDIFLEKYNVYYLLD